MWEIGLFTYLEQKYTPDVMKCFVDMKRTRKVTQLNLTDLFSALVLYCSGVAISICVFLVETVVAVMLGLAK